MGEKVSSLYTGAIITEHTNANQWRLAYLNSDPLHDLIGKGYFHFGDSEGP